MTDTYTLTHEGATLDGRAVQVHEVDGGGRTVSIAASKEKPGTSAGFVGDNAGDFSDFLRDQRINESTLIDVRPKDQRTSAKSTQVDDDKSADGGSANRGNAPVPNPGAAAHGPKD